MPGIESGDLVIRGTIADGFELVEAITSRYVAGPFEMFATAMVAARVRHPHAIWQQSVDHRGRLLGDPLRLPLPTA